MKNFSFVIIVLLSCYLFSSCKKANLGEVYFNTSNNSGISPVTSKSSGTVTQSALVGYWQLVNDSSTTVPWGLWQGMPTTYHSYIGQPADHYQFTADGHLYDNIQGVIDTGVYTMSNDTVHVVYTFFNDQETTNGIYNTYWVVSIHTPNSLTFSDTYVSPETATTVVYNLKKQ